MFELYHLLRSTFRANIFTFRLLLDLEFQNNRLLSILRIYFSSWFILIIPNVFYYHWLCYYFYYSDIRTDNLISLRWCGMAIWNDEQMR